MAKAPLQDAQHTEHAEGGAWAGDPQAAQAALDAWDELAPLLTLSKAQKQLTRATKAAILTVLTDPNASPREAAEAQGITLKAYNRAMSKPHVQALVKQIKKALRECWADKAAATFAGVMLKDRSALNRMRAAEWLAGIEGIAPTKRQEIQHTNAPQPVGIIIMDPRQLESGQNGTDQGLIDVTPDCASGVDCKKIEK